MYRFTEDFLLIYFNNAKRVNYEDLTIFLDLNFSQLIKILRSMTERELLSFSDGRFHITETGVKTIEEYNQDVFDFSDGITLKKSKDDFLFHESKYLPKDFYKKFKI